MWSLSHASGCPACPILSAPAAECWLISSLDMLLFYKLLNPDCPRNGARLYQVVPSNRTRGKGTNWCTGKWDLEMRKNSITAWVSKYWHRLPRKLWHLPQWKYSRSIWMQSCAMCFRVTLLKQGGWDLMTHCGPFQPFPFCDCETWFRLFLVINLSCMIFTNTHPAHPVLQLRNGKKDLPATQWKMILQC